MLNKMVEDETTQVKNENSKIKTETNTSLKQIKNVFAQDEMQSKIGIENINKDCFLVSPYYEEKQDKYKISFDKITIPDSQDFLEQIQNKSYPISDYAIMCGAHFVLNNNERFGNLWLKSTKNANANVYTAERHFKKYNVSTFDSGILPVIELKLENILKLNKNVIIQADKLNEKSSKRYINLGFAPNNFVGIDNQQELNNLFASNKLKQTGNKYFSYLSNDGSLVCSDEYIDLNTNKRYVKTNSKVSILSLVGKSALSNSNFNNVKDDKFLWVEVTPIKWQIQNYNSILKLINEKSKGRQLYFNLIPNQILFAGLPFNLQKEDVYWQNSVIRTFLNGSVEYGKTPTNLEQSLIDVSFLNILINNNSMLNINGNAQQKQNLANAKNLGLNENKEVLGNKQEVLNNNQIKKQTKLSRIQKILQESNQKLSSVKLTDTEKIYSWINNGESICLRGPSGIGKTERFSNFKNLVYLKLSNNMFPEIVNGSVNLETGETIPPEYLKQAYLMLATNEEKEEILKDVRNLYKYKDAILERSKTEQAKKEPIILLLDELLNVKPTIQSLVFNLVLNKRVEVARGLYLPHNVVVVATGNQKKYSSVANDMAEPLEKRFDHILDMEPKVGEWLNEYAIPNKLHPLVVSYIYYNYQKSGMAEDIGLMNYFYEEPEVGEKFVDKYGNNGKTNDPRSWTAISKMLYNFEDGVKKGLFEGKDVDDLLWTTLLSKLRKEWAVDFYYFYNTLTISLDDVLKDNFSANDVPNKMSEKFAQLGVLLTANENQIIKTRNFVKSYFESEYLALFDMYWVGKDEERADIICKLQEKDFVDMELALNNSKLLNAKQESKKEDEVLDSVIPNNFKYNLDEFWSNAKKQKYIMVRVNSVEEDEFLRKAFRNSGKKWYDGTSFLSKSNMQDKAVQTYYVNNCFVTDNERFGIKEFEKCEFIDFKDLNIEEYLTPKDKILWRNILNKENLTQKEDNNQQKNNKDTELEK